MLDTTGSTGQGWASCGIGTRGEVVPAADGRAGGGWDDGGGAGSRSGGAGDDESRQVREWLDTMAWEAAEPGWEQLVEFARTLGPDPTFAEVSDADLDAQVRCQAAELAAATCRWLEHVAELVVRGIWADQGAKTPAMWLSWAIGLAPSTAREHVRVALQLRELPQLRGRFRDGRISYSKVRALTRVAVPEIEPMLLAWADAATAAEIERLVAGFRRSQRAAAVTAKARDAGRRVFLQPGPDGLVDVVVRALPEEAAELMSLLDRLDELETAAASAADASVTDASATSASATDASATSASATDVSDAVEASSAGAELADGPISPARRRASRLVDTLLHALVHVVADGPTDTSGADRHTLVLAADVDDLSDAEDGRASVQVSVQDGAGRSVGMDRRVLRRLACDAGIVMLLRDRDGTPMDLGRRDRRLSAALRRALLQRDRTCRFPGCTQSRHLHAHHVEHWADGGPTDLANLVALCPTHHRFVHDHGWQVVPQGHGRFGFGPPGSDLVPRSGQLALISGSEPASTSSRRPHRPDDLEPLDWPGLDAPPDMDLTVAVLQEELRRNLDRDLTTAA